MRMLWAPAAGSSGSSLGLRRNGRPRHLGCPGFLQVDQLAGHLGCCSLIWGALAVHRLTSDSQDELADWRLACHRIGLLAGDCMLQPEANH